MAEMEDIYEAFFPEEFEKRQGAATKRFVHYTSADVAKSIIENKQVWMRNTRTMNDFREIRHGMECLQRGLRSPEGEELHELLLSIDGTGLNAFRNGEYLDWHKDGVYITCISEHEDNEDGLGRLSMWRAYGGTTGVAMVIKNTPFMQRNDHLGAWTFPVTYCDLDGHLPKFRHMLERLKGKIEYYRTEGREAIENIYIFLLFLALCTKHHGFAEEKEWRVVYNSVYTAPYLKRIIASVRGTPQKVHLLPLRDIEEIDFRGASIPDLIDHIIIGPTTHPQVMGEAFVELLREAKVPNPESKVRISDIPLRHYS